MYVGWEDSFFAVVLNVVTIPLRGGGEGVVPQSPRLGDSGDVVLCLVWCWRVSAWCGEVGVVECNCCFVVVERFLKGRGELELVVEGVDGDE